MNQWPAPERPNAHAEKALLTNIIDGTYPAGTNLPAERELAARLGVTRPTLREALRRLESDGWLTVQQGKPTRVNDFWHDGGLNVLSSLVRYSQELPPNFVTHLLEVRLAMAPAYTRAAVMHSAVRVAALLAEAAGLPDTPEHYAAFDWKLHHALTTWSENPIYTLILNGFAGFYEEMARHYFASPTSRDRSKCFYQALYQHASEGDARQAEQVTQQVMAESIQLWAETTQEGEA